MKCDPCKLCNAPLAYSHEHGGVYEVGAPGDGFSKHTTERCRDRLAAQIVVAREALTKIRNVEMSPHPPHTVDAGVRLIAADALLKLEAA